MSSAAYPGAQPALPPQQQQPQQLYWSQPSMEPLGNMETNQAASCLGAMGCFFCVCGGGSVQKTVAQCPNCKTFIQ
eukprot:jgi/Hompol1/3310/HPOL_000543-RA